MRTAVALLSCLVVSQSLCCCLGAKVKTTKGKAPILGPWIETHKKQENQQLSKLSGKKVNISPKILNGYTGKQAFYALIKIDVASVICGGTIISDSFVLTSATCMNGGGVDIKVILGYFDDTQTELTTIIDVPASNILIHKEYNPVVSENAHDIALVNTGPITFTEFIKPLDLHLGPIYPDLIGNWFVLAGVGYINMNFEKATSVKYTSLQLTDMANCTYYNQLNQMNSDSEMCLIDDYSSYGACKHDEGGPVVYYKFIRQIDEENNLYETYLGGIIAKQPNGCPPSEGFPSRALQIYPYLCWIQENTGEDFGVTGCIQSACVAKGNKKALKKKNNKKWVHEKPKTINEKKTN